MDSYGYNQNRPRWLLLGAAGLAAVVLLAVGFGAGRASAPGAGGGPVAGSGQSGPGPTRVVNGVPVGYAHTEAGAVAAATNFLMVVDGPLVTQPDKYRAAIDTLSAPEARAKQQTDAQQLVTTMQNSAGLVTYAQQGHTVVFRASPLAYHVDRYDGTRAQVSIWTEGFTAVDGVLTMREIWVTTTFTVEWSLDDWRLVEIAPATPASFGPVPIVGQASTQSVVLPPQLATYRRYRIDVGP